MAKTHRKDDVVIDIWADGSYYPKYNVGGIGLLVRTNGQDYIVSEGRTDGSSSCAYEALAFYFALKHAIKNIKGRSAVVTIYIDLVDLVTASESYLKDVAEGNFPYYSREITSALTVLKETSTLSIKWVKAHKGDTNNTLSDTLAKEAAKALVQEANTRIKLTKRVLDAYWSHKIKTVPDKVLVTFLRNHGVKVIKQKSNFYRCSDDPIKYQEGNSHVLYTYVAIIAKRLRDTAAANK